MVPVVCNVSINTFACCPNRWCFSIHYWPNWAWLQCETRFVCCREQHQPKVCKSNFLHLLLNTVHRTPDRVHISIWIYWLEGQNIDQVLHLPRSSKAQILYSCVCHIIIYRIRRDSTPEMIQIQKVRLFLVWIWKWATIYSWHYANCKLCSMSLRRKGRYCNWLECVSVVCICWFLVRPLIALCNLTGSTWAKSTLTHLFMMKTLWNFWWTQLAR